MNTEKIRNIMLNRENNLSEYASRDNDAIRIKRENKDIRPEYFHDTDRIIYSLSYTRYLNKTQVFSFKENDHLSKRIVHVQFVSKIARTIARALSLNEDLTEAIALGHDIGHTPIGHTGEAILNEISMQELGRMFNHNVHSVRNYMYIENNGNGINLTVQTLDGIMCHNGEFLSNVYEPKKKTVDEFLLEYEKSYTDKRILNGLRPMTLEGCIVRISDIIAYIGRDLEDAISIDVLNRCDIPESITNVLGNNNKEIINTIIMDIIENSMNKPYIKLSKTVYDALLELKKFNYEYIYNKANNLDSIKYYKNGMWSIYKKCLNDLNQNDKESDIYKIYVSKMSAEYLKNNSNKQIVIDYIAGMTDEFFNRSIKNIEKK